MFTTYKCYERIDTQLSHFQFIHLTRIGKRCLS